MYAPRATAWSVSTPASKPTRRTTLALDPLMIMLLALYIVGGILIWNLATSQNPRIVLACGFVACLIALTSYGVFAS